LICREEGKRGKKDIFGLSQEEKAEPSRPRFESDAKRGKGRGFQVRRRGRLG